jgi:hypothetical protein
MLGRATGAVWQFQPLGDPVGQQLGLVEARSLRQAGSAKQSASESISSNSRTSALRWRVAERLHSETRCEPWRSGNPQWRMVDGSLRGGLAIAVLRKLPFHRQSAKLAHVATHTRASQALVANGRAGSANEQPFAWPATSRQGCTSVLRRRPRVSRREMPRCVELTSDKRISSSEAYSSRTYNE